MLDIKRLQASSRRDKSVGKPQRARVPTHKSNLEKLFLVQTSARFPPIEPDSWVTRPTPEMHIQKWAAQGYNEPECIIVIVIVIIIQMKNDRINFRFLGNCPPTPPLSQQFALCKL